MDFTPMQRAAIEHDGGAMLISAGAGSGKTRVLIERLMRLIDEGTDVDRFLVITYTRAAAAELRGRLSSAISERLSRNPADRRMRRQASLIYRARINTIHSFCSDVIRESAHTVGVRPDFRQMDEAEAAALLSETLEELLEARYEALTQEFQQLTDMLGAGRDDSVLSQIVLETWHAVQSHPYPEKWMAEQTAQSLAVSDAGQTPWGRLLLDRALRSARYWRGSMAAELSSLGEDEGAAKAYLPSWQETVASLDSFIAALEEGWDAARLFGEVSFPRLGTLRGRAGDEYIERIRALREGCKKAMAKLTGGFDTPSDGLLADMEAIRPVTNELYAIVAELDRAYGEAKKRRGALDFGDLEHLAVQILCCPDTGAPTERAAEISSRFAEILVDEYQDVNRMQELIFSAVSRSGGNITMVGDVKQSIYRFRLADPGIFLEKYAAYAEYPAPPGAPVRIRLAHNFRSRPEILETVNYVFSRLMSPELGEMRYGESECMLPGRTDAAAFAEPVELCLCCPPEGEDRVKYEAECAAGYVERLLTSGALVEGRPIRPGDVALLLRSMKGRAETFLAALEARGIPASAAGGSSGLFDGFENSYLLSILRVIDNPVQDIPLIAALRGPVWRFTADELAHIRAAAPGSFYAALRARAVDDGKCAEFLKELDALRRLAAELPADALIRAVLDRTGLPALSEARQRGSAERLYMVQSYAESCETAGCRGLYGFLNRLDASEPPKITRSAEGGVTVMSIHGSKGLEFPVVLLCDLARQFNLQDSRRPLLIHRELGAGAKFLDRERGIEYPTLARRAVAAKINNETLSEELRVLYVAMTRPREKLVCLCSVRDAEETVARLRLGLSDPPAPELLESCHSLSDWLLTAMLTAPDFHYSLLAPPDTEADAAPEAAPAAEAANEELKSAIRASLSWRAPGNSEGLPSKVTATALKSGFRAAEAAEDAAEIAPVPDEKRDSLRRPGFISGSRALTPTERGTALHMAMQLMDFSRGGSIEEISGEIERMRVMRLLSPAQADSVEPERILGFFRSELGRRALKARDTLRREFKFSVLIPASDVYGRGEGDVLLQGVIDLFFEEEDGVVLVDFKSDRVTKATRAGRAGLYAGQLDAYAEALRRITGRPVKEKRLFFFACDGEG